MKVTQSEALIARGYDDPDLSFSKLGLDEVRLVLAHPVFEESNSAPQQLLHLLILRKQCCDFFLKLLGLAR